MGVSTIGACSTVRYRLATQRMGDGCTDNRKTRTIEDTSWQFRNVHTVTGSLSYLENLKNERQKRIEHKIHVSFLSATFIQNICGLFRTCCASYV
jgi:hypothetical protein